jgi:4'-phosphopantetheinyl transferase
LVLACYLDCSPSSIRFQTVAHGKPVVEARISFNLSHTEGLGLIAVADRTVGIDVETDRDDATAEALVRRFFDPVEQTQFQTLPIEMKSQGFLRGWTLKEAILKAVGCGASGLDGCTVDLDPRQPPAIIGLRGPAAALGPNWSLACWRAAGHATAAVAILPESTT